MPCPYTPLNPLLKEGTGAVGDVLPSIKLKVPPYLGREGPGVCLFHSRCNLGLPTYKNSLSGQKEGVVAGRGIEPPTSGL